MSVQAMAWVLDHSPTEGGDRLVLLSIANHAGRTPVRSVDGITAWEAWPGLQTIGREAGLSRRQSVKDALGRLERGGHLQRIVNAAPDDRLRRDRRPNLYRIVIDAGTRTELASRAHGSTPTELPSRAHGGTRTEGPFDEPPRSNGGTLSARTGARGPSPEPSLNPDGYISSDDCHARELAERAAVDALHVLTARDIERTPDADESSSLAARVIAHRDELIELALRHPSQSSVWLADCVELADCVDPARNRSAADLAGRTPPSEAELAAMRRHTAAARAALRGLTVVES